MKIGLIVRYPHDEARDAIMPQTYRSRSRKRLTQDSVGIIARIADVLGSAPQQGFRIHLDTDVLVRAVMPAIDSPGNSGMAPEDLVAILRPLVADRLYRGMTVTVIEPTPP